MTLDRKKDGYGPSSKSFDYLIDKKVDYKTGTYAQVTGPNYETRAEIRMLRKFGSDAVGMSTGIEVNFASMLGLKCVACSLITNKASEIAEKKITHAEVLNEAVRATNQIKHFITGAIEAVEKKI